MHGLLLYLDKRHSSLNITIIMFGLLLSIVINILSLGAQPGDESTNNAPIINQAIRQCAEAGGGSVVIPSGVFTTGSIYLQSGVRLHLERGAVLKGSRRLADYAPLRTHIDLSKYESGQGTVNYNSATDPQWSLALIHGVGISQSGI